MNDTPVRIFEALVNAAWIYAAVGFIISVLFVARWYKSFDPSAAQGTWGFRALIIPGVVALWPVIVAKAIQVRRGGVAEGGVESPVNPPALRRNHGVAFVVLAILGPLLFLAVLTWRVKDAQSIPSSSFATQLTRN